MQQQLTLTKNEMAIWTWLVSKGIANALSGLSQMVGQELSVTSLDLKHFPAKEAANLLGGPENLVIGIYLTVHGDAAGHLMLIHEPKIAFELIDMQMGLVSGSTRSLDEMERSIMGEMGNITGSFFLNALADATNLSLIPSPPAVLIDMAGAILGIALTEIMQEQDDIIVVKTAFGTPDREVNGTFLVMPTMSFLKIILEHSGASWQ
jgi:chemotaxis protein CheC